MIDGVMVSRMGSFEVGLNGEDDLRLQCIWKRSLILDFYMSSVRLAVSLSRSCSLRDLYRRIAKVQGYGCEYWFAVGFVNGEGF